MSVLIITHTLNNKTKDYAPFFEALKSELC